MLALTVGSAYTRCMQYTIRGIPPAIDEAVRERAKAEGKSLNEVAVEALADGLGLGDEDIVRRDLSDVAGTWKREAAVEAVLAAQDRVDEDLWK
jgi:hypothetical protein